MYTTINFKTKKALKEAVAKFLVGEHEGVTFYQPGPFGNQVGLGHETKVYIEGPHYPEPHRWYAECKVAHDVIIHVK